ncbi:MAG TPA: prolyl oligopeptidase family serine peptidase [Gaiellaceae bacterium]|nr:prolyl oligopeptidase family serine peptidase [Gaiellaceae bacterium]
MSAASDAAVTRPATRTGEETVDLHGRSIPDPYRWLEADADSPEVAAWIEAQNAYTESILAASPAREAIRSRLTQLFGFPKVGTPSEHGGRWLQWRNTGLQNQSVLYVADAPDAEGRVLLDPNTLAADGATAVMGTSVSRDGSLLAYAVSDGGSDWMTWRVREVETGDDRPDLVEWSKVSGVAWAPDGSGFWYGAFDAPQAGQELYERNGAMRVAFHRLGTPQSDDLLVYERPDEPELFFMPQLTFDGRYLVVTVVHSTAQETELHVLDLEAADPAWQTLVGDRTSRNTVIGNEGRDFLLLTDHEASRRRIVRVSLDAPERDSWVEVVPEGEHKLTGAGHVGGRLVCHYLAHAASALEVFDTAGTHLHSVAVPAFSGVLELSGRPDELELSGSPDRPLVFFSSTSFCDPVTIWSHDVASGETTQVWTSAIPLDRDEIVTEQVFVESLDGTAVPVFLVHRKDVVPNGEVPVLLTAYGGFNIPVTPVFAIYSAGWVDRGGVFASANLRGGGEYGLDWYHGGRRERKQNVFDDFCSVARWFHSSGWSNPSRIAVKGKSNGGLLVGACVTQHPELFGAVVPEVGVLDMLRFPRFTIGWAWMPEYGNPDDETEFGWLLDYSPLHNVRPGTRYPAILVTTGDHDDRVVPGHSFKFAAALQAAQAGDAPVAIRVETRAGHGAGKPTAKIISEFTDILAFAELALGIR